VAEDQADPDKDHARLDLHDPDEETGVDGRSDL